MKTHSPRFLLTAALSLCLSPVFAGTELSLIKGSMESASTVSGSIQQLFTPNHPRLKVKLSGLSAGATYHFLVGGVVQAEFVAAANGRHHLRFDRNPLASEFLLDFDPRGQLLALNDGTNDVLTMVCSGENEPVDLRVDERTALQPVDDTVSGKVRVRYLEQKNQDRFIIHYSSLELGNYDLFIDGLLKAELDMTRKRSGMLTYRLHKNGKQGNGKSPALDFDPRGKVVDLVKDGVVKFSGVMLAQVPGVNVVEAQESTTELTSTGVDADATATVEYKLESDGERELTVSVANLPDGDYTVLIGGNEFTLSVPDGELRFSSHPVGDELLLDFDPLGAEVVISQAPDTTFFTGTIGATTQTSDVVVHMELPLLNQGVDSNATAGIVFEANAAGPLEFRVDAHNLADGVYSLFVGGLVKGTLTVTTVGGVSSGAVEFSAAPSNGALLLDFDPRGQVVDLAQGGVVYLSRTLPE